MASHRHLQAGDEADAPPPPYSETDIYSNAGGSTGRSPISPATAGRRRSSNSNSRRHSHGGGGDDAATQSTSSTIDGEVIYTPPLTPRSNSHHSHHSSGAPAPLSNFGGELDHLGGGTSTSTTSSSAAAAAYFISRPPPPDRGLSLFVHTVRIFEDGNDEVIPYPGPEMAARDVSLDDWRTFVNFLVPDFAAARNERLVDRKLRAEMMSEAAEEVRSQAETEAAVAQIEGLRIGSSPRQQVVDVGVAEATVREWNEGFFAPRGVVVRLDTLSGGGGNKNEDGGMQVPGAWDTSFDREAGTAAAGPSTVPANGARSRFARLNPFSSSGGNNNTGGGGNGAFRFGGITVDGDRLSIGDRFVADRNGLRIGGIVADGNGITLHGQPMFGAGPMAGGHHGGFGPGGPFGGVRGGPGMCGPRGTPPWGAGGPRGGFGHGPWGGRGGGGIWGGVGAGGAPQDYDDAAGACGGRGRRGGRGRGRHNGKGRQRSRSSSVSSQSSSSSSSSESSVGSLPEYEDLRDPQLGVARERLQQWLRDPNQPITRAKVKALREEIKQAKTNESLVPGDTDRNALRKEVKALLKEWKGLKKQQSKANKQIRRERRQKRREEKRERRSVRREMRRAERDWRRGRGHHQHPHPHAPPPHGMPGAFPFPFGGAPHVPPVPPVPGAAPGLFGPRGGLGNLFGGAGGGPAGPGPAGPSRTPPGAWPQENLDTLGPSHRASQAKYRAAEGLEKQIAAKEAELLRVHEAIARGEEEARNRGSGSDNKNQGGGDHKIQTPAETNAFRLETEIEALGRSMAQLRTEADEEFARELAEEEQRRAW